jgi:hypothetical protein
MTMTVEHFPTRPALVLHAKPESPFETIRRKSAEAASEATELEGRILAGARALADDLADLSKLEALPAGRRDCAAKLAAAVIVGADNIQSLRTRSAR